MAFSAPTPPKKPVSERIKEKSKKLNGMGPLFKLDSSFESTPYYKSFTGFRNAISDDLGKLSAQDAQIKNVNQALLAIEEFLSQQYKNMAKDPNFTLNEKELGELFKSATDALSAIKNTPAVSPELAKVIDEKTASLEEYGSADKVGELLEWLDQRLESKVTTSTSESKRLEAMYEQAQAWGHVPGGDNFNPDKKILFDPVGVAPILPGDIDPLNPMLGTTDKEYWMRQLKRLADAKLAPGEQSVLFKGYIEDETGEKLNERLFQMTADGCQPKPPIDSKGATYRNEYKSTIQLVRYTNPHCIAILSFPLLKQINMSKGPKALAEDLKFIHSMDIREKLIPVMEESVKLGVPMKIDPKLKGILTEQLLKEQNRSKLSKKIWKKTKKEKDIEDLFALETSMASKLERDANLGKNKDEMKGKVQRESEKLKNMSVNDLKAEYEAELANATPKQAQSVLGNMPQNADAKEAKNAAQIADEIKEENRQKFAAAEKVVHKGPPPITTEEEKRNNIDAQLKALESNLLQVEKSLEMINFHQNFLDDYMKKEIALPESKPDPFIIEHAKNLGDLAQKANTQMAKLKYESEVLRQAANKLSNDNPSTENQALQQKAVEVKTKASQDDVDAQTKQNKIEKFNKKYAPEKQKEQKQSFKVAR